MKDQTKNTLKTPLDFKQQYLSDGHHSFCAACDILPHQEKNNFLEIAPLEALKSLHKSASFDSARRRFYTAILLTAGNVRETIGHHTYTFDAGTLYFIPENQLHTIHSWSEDVKGYHCIFDTDYFLLCIKNQVKLNRFPFFQPGKDPYVKLSEEETAMMIPLFMKLSKEYCSRKTLNDDLLVRLYLNVLLIETEKVYQSQHIPVSRELPRKEQLTTSFRQLVSQHFLELRHVTDYARQLHVNAHYLNDTVKELTGRSASSFIHHQLMTEAKAQLIQTDETIAGISDSLNFTDQSYFCRFFKKHTGLTPLQFRKNHQH
ncbi:helix-turn-helix domain-containing protein [Chitinophaga solisilvae]|uniref:helix-turn-helix domain-containing protein n=1 Tax=Chitinophaga solisilvae TaxID=1233460 RepID=UPI00136DCC70|nr:AraC family transcriptional regulator [Chitinophaga solisilvae]